MGVCSRGGEMMGEITAMGVWGCFWRMIRMKPIRAGRNVRGERLRPPWMLMPIFREITSAGSSNHRLGVTASQLDLIALFTRRFSLHRLTSALY